jgi:AraC-like DNA-binding protein
MVLGEATVELLAPCLRMVQLLHTPQDVPFFGKLLQREIIYRLLLGPQGDRRRSVATLADQSYRTAKAVTWLRDNFKKTLNVDELASMTCMSRSTLNHHFRGLTAMSPLQFQKQLRLHTARQKMLTEELDAASAAFEVGYESPSQFNREYKRFFGQPPMRDIQALRACLRLRIFVTFTSEQLRSALISSDARRGEPAVCLFVGSSGQSETNRTHSSGRNSAGSRRPSESEPVAAAPYTFRAMGLPGNNPV